jgi:hypothetical protein
MTWVAGKSGNPKGRPPGRIKKATQEVIAKLVGRDLPPSEMAAALLRRLFDIGCDPNNPVPVQIQAVGTALPYLAPRLQITAQVTRGVGDFSDCKTVDECASSKTLAPTARSCSGKLWPVTILAP